MMYVAIGYEDWLDEDIQERTIYAGGNHSFSRLLRACERVAQHQFDEFIHTFENQSHWEIDYEMEFEAATMEEDFHLRDESSLDSVMKPKNYFGTVSFFFSIPGPTLFSLDRSVYFDIYQI